MDNKKLSALFSKFSGKELAVNITPVHAEEAKRGVPHVVTVSLDLGEPAIVAMTKAAAEKGLDLRVNFGDEANRIVCGKTPSKDCVNVYIEQSPDGKYRVGKKFKIG